MVSLISATHRPDGRCRTPTNRFRPRCAAATAPTASAHDSLDLAAGAKLFDAAWLWPPPQEIISRSSAKPGDALRLSAMVYLWLAGGTVKVKHFCCQV